MPSLLERTDPRPILVSVLGGAWVVMCGFGLLRAVILVAGISDGVEIPRSYDPNVELAQTHPELVDDGWFEAQARNQERVELERRLGLPLLLLSMLGIFGGVWLLQNRSRARTILAVTGIGVIALSAWHARQMLELSMRVDQSIVIPEDVNAAFWSVAAINVALQSLPVVVGLGLLRHPSLSRWVRGGATPDSLSAG